MHNPTLVSDSELIEEFVSELLNEEAIFHPIRGGREGRSALRRDFVRAIQVEIESGEKVGGYCSNISRLGAELITQDPFLFESKAIIHIGDYDQKRFLRFVAECRWTQDNGVGGLLSGWSFLKALPREN